MKRIRKLVLPYHLQFFAEGDEGATEGGTDAGSSLDNLNNLLDSMGTNTDGAATGSTDNADTGTGATDNADADTKDQTQATQTTKQTKEEFTFAQMRTQNTQLLGLLGKVAQATGLDFKDNKELLAKLNEDVIGKLAKQQNVPVELLQRLEQLEGINQIHQTEQLQKTAVQGFTDLKTQQGLTDDELRSFAGELDAAGKNPFIAQVDIMEEYRRLHWNDIITKETQKAVEEALKKSSAADKHSSTPGNADGKPDAGTPAKVNTIMGLNALLNEMK